MHLYNRNLGLAAMGYNPASPAWAGRESLLGLVHHQGSGMNNNLPFGDFLPSSLSPLSTGSHIGSDNEMDLVSDTLNASKH